MIILGLGANSGDRLSCLRRAIYLLRTSLPESQFKVIAISPLYESKALLPPGAPSSWNIPFLNLAVLAESSLTPLELLAYVKTVERLLGRVNSERWAPRNIDIDILAIDFLQLKSDQLTIPHLGLMERPFAALPFADLLPAWRHPGQGSHSGKSMEEWTSQWRNESPRNVPFETKRSLDHLVELIAILNVTPDSFSGDGKLFEPEKLIHRVGELEQQGYRIVDLGAESTRPHAHPISPKEEWERLREVLFIIRDKYPNLILSIDTRNAHVAEKALELGAHWINDVSGLEDEKMQNLAVQSNARFVVMHNRGIPAALCGHLDPKLDALEQIAHWAEGKLASFAALGVPKDRIILDPGIGFGKTPMQSWNILRNIRKMQRWGIPLLVGHSRKSFLSTVTNFSPCERDLETAIISVHLASLNVEYLRVHQPEISSRALRTWCQMDGIIRCTS